MKAIFHVLIILFFIEAHACTDFILQSKDGSFVVGRSLEFASELETILSIHSAGESHSSKAPNGEKSIQWTSKYGYIGTNAFGQPFVVDGLNEAGLSYGALWLPGTEYQIITSSDGSKALDLMDLGDWILSNFATVKEVKAALKRIKVWGHVIPPLTIIPPIHMILHDASGNSLVVEFIKGEMKVYDNPIGVATNCPTFDWQITNLQNYTHLNAKNAGSININGITINPPGEGSGMIGIPGDWTPPSRFIKIATYLRFVQQAQNSLEGVNLAQHLLNTVDIPKGTIQNKDSNEGDFTQWIVIKDLTNRVFYFRSYNDLSLKAIHFLHLLKSGGTNKTIPIDFEKGIIDVTSSLQ